MPAKIIIPNGTIFGKLTVQGLVDIGDPRSHFLCQCECGNQVISLGVTLRIGDRTHCGCFTSQAHMTHGLSKSPEYKSWQLMKSRCYDVNNASYSEYGGSGITVGDEWRHDFMAFYNHVGPKPSPQHSLDRFPNKFGNYEPGNVRWATKQEQALNRRDNLKFTLNGVTAPIAYWLVEMGIRRECLVARRRSGWSDERALTTPVRPRHKQPPTTPPSPALLPALAALE